MKKSKFTNHYQENIVETPIYIDVTHIIIGNGKSLS
jgi:hypothetical protein